jgi:hypothetical protein
VAFGQNEGSSHLDVARTSIRKVERLAAKMKSEDMIANPNVLKYLNRLSDLIFLLACFEEKDEAEKQKIKRSLFSARPAKPLPRKWRISLASIIFILIITIVLLLIFHRPAPQESFDSMQNHMKQMESMH